MAYGWKVLSKKTSRQVCVWIKIRTNIFITHESFYNTLKKILL